MEQWEIKAFKFAQESHKGQIDKEGKDYFINHILPVVSILKMAIRDNESFSGTDYQRMITAGYLHDTIEDCHNRVIHFEIKMKTQYGERIHHYILVDKENIERIFGKEVYELVKEVTHTKSQVFPNLKTLDGYILKFADRLANLSRRKGGMNEKELKRYMKCSVFWKSE